MRISKCLEGCLPAGRLIAIVFVLVLSAHLAAAAGSEIAAVEAGQNQMVWQTLAPNDGAVLTITGPGDVAIRSEFQAGDQPAFRTAASFPDGTYRYELELKPRLDGPTRAAMLAARSAGTDAPLTRDLREKGLLPREPMVMVGTFNVSGGQIMLPGPASDSKGDNDGVAKDVLHYDDVIITGSLCVGFDCADGESFGFDTIRLKEHNLRIHFDDTSYTASYPRNDWRVIINDSTNGGASYWGVEDSTDGRRIFTLEAGAPSHSLYVEDYGRVGLGTSTPVVELHVKDSDTPTMRLEQDSSGGWTAQTFDVAGNESNFFIRDATNGSKLPFRIQPSTPSSTLTLKSSGYVGIGTWSPDKKLDIEADGPAFRLTNIGSGGGIWDFKVNGTNGRLNITDDSTASRVPIKVDTGADDNLLRIGVVASDQVDIDGDLVVSGTITPDYVFNPLYQLESIEEHAAFMWRERHLPAVTPATPAADGRHQINVGARSQGMLEELEKAHIYIEQLKGEIDDLKQEDNRKNELIEALATRLAAVEAQLR